MADMEKSAHIPEVKDNRPTILGLLPKNTQGKLIAAISLLMVVIIMLSGRNQPKERAKAPLAASSTMDPSASRIQEYRTLLDEQTRQLAVEEAQLTQTKQALGVREPVGISSAGRAQATTLNSYRSEPERSWIETDREKREYQSLYASNVALSYRRKSAEEAVTLTRPTAVSDAIVSQPLKSRETVATTADHLAPNEFRLFEGTIIETVLTNRLDASFSGPVNSLVTTPVYAPDHQTLLIPQGTRVLGEVRKVETASQQRIAVTFHRLVMPNGFSVSLDQFHGLNQVGETGLRDQVNHHYLQIFGASLAIGAIAGLSQANTRFGVDASAVDAYRQGMASSLSQSSLHILDHYLNVLPTFTVREGHRIKVYLSQDLKLPAYDQDPAVE